MPWKHKSRRCIYCGHVGPRTLTTGGYAHKRCIPTTPRATSQPYWAPAPLPPIKNGR